MYPLINFSLPKVKGKAFYAFLLIFAVCISANAVQASSFCEYHSHINTIYIENDKSNTFALTEFPQNLQLYARDTATNRAIVEVAGEVATHGDSVSLVIWRDNVPFAQYGAKPDTDFAFAFYPEIQAELAQYTFELYEITTSGTTLRASVADVVAGDVYIINGQSNAEAQMFDGSSMADSSRFIRVYGSGTHDYTAFQKDTLWHIGQGDGNRFSKGNTGQWGLYFAKQIIDNQKIPVCIFNGARSGQRMQAFRRYDLNPQFNNNYGRLLSRLYRSNLADKVRAILWYQGEEDVIVTTPNRYKQFFKSIYDDWATDYPSVEQIYLTEIRTGCLAKPHEAVLIQNALRQLANKLPRTGIVSAKGLEQDIPCHFKYKDGYRELGRRFYRLIKRDIYGDTVAVVESPNISTAIFTAPDEITLTMQAADTLIWEIGSENDFVLEGDSLISVISGYTNGNTVVLQLSGDATHISGITYLDKSGEGITSPFITNSEGYGMISFFNFPIEPQICPEIDLEVHHTHVFDQDLFIDGVGFKNNPVVTFTDPATPANAVLSDVSLELYFKLNSNSCENEIAIQLTDPAGNTQPLTTYTTCDSGNGLYYINLNVPSGNTAGSVADWVVEFDDTNDQNSDYEYSVRFARLNYVASTVGGSNIPIVNKVSDISDSDLFIDGLGFANNNTYTFTDPATPADATLSDISLELYFKLNGNSCENEIAIQLTDPAGNTQPLTAYTTCDGGNGLYYVNLDVPSGSTTGSVADWVVEFDDTNDQNTDYEYSVRFGRLTYTTTYTQSRRSMPVAVNEKVSDFADSDLFIDGVGFANNDTYTFADPGTPTDAVLSNISLELYFILKGNSCENEIAIQITDPAGNTQSLTAYTTCDSGNGLYYVNLNVPSGNTTGSVADWVVEFDDTNDQNTDYEYSVRFGRLTYDTEYTECVPILVNKNTSVHQGGGTSTGQHANKLARR